MVTASRPGDAEELSAGEARGLSDPEARPGRRRNPLRCSKQRWKASTQANGNRVEQHTVAQIELQQRGRGDCLEVADGSLGAVHVRDSKYAEEGPVLMLTTLAWTQFVASLKRGSS
ncbi:DUF397 domain-containing protein [Streptomyces sp. NPDC093250]|uniref:DUF397 domain-containing protein n=1 Tax=Streptomyces sp. NPDC093250 TaxID=3366036 RepID=UPI00382FA8DB